MNNKFVFKGWLHTKLGIFYYLADNEKCCTEHTHSLDVHSFAVQHYLLWDMTLHFAVLNAQVNTF